MGIYIILNVLMDVISVKMLKYVIYVLQKNIYLIKKNALKEYQIVSNIINLLFLLIIFLTEVEKDINYVNDVIMLMVIIALIWIKQNVLTIRIILRKYIIKWKIVIIHVLVYAQIFFQIVQNVTGAFVRNANQNILLIKRVKDAQREFQIVKHMMNLVLLLIQIMEVV